MNLGLMQRIFPFLHNLLIHIMSLPTTKASIQNTNYIFVIHLYVTMTPPSHTPSKIIKSRNYTTLRTPQSCPIKVVTPLFSYHNKITFG